MKYVKQFGIIIVVSFLGEVLHSLIPIPVPASIYGLTLMFAGLVTGFIPHEGVRETGHFLVDIMAIMFLPAAVGPLDAFDVLRPVLAPFAVTTVVSTVLVMVVSGKVTQAVMDRNRKTEDIFSEEFLKEEMEGECR